MDDRSTQAHAVLDIATITRGIVRVQVFGEVDDGYDVQIEQAYTERYGARHWELWDDPQGARSTLDPPPPDVLIDRVVLLRTEEDLSPDEWEPAEPALRRALGRAVVGVEHDLHPRPPSRSAPAR